MTKGFPATAAGVLILVAAAAAAIMIFNGTSAAQTDESGTEDGSAAERPKPPYGADALLAVAIGTVENEEGTDPTIDLRAHETEEHEGGAFRFCCEKMGYYNGGVQDVTFEDGIITATGAGGLWKIDGTKVPVQFALTVDTESGMADVTITGPGVDYNTSGPLDGFSWAGSRGDAPPFAN